jgi:hypothetical protein
MNFAKRLLMVFGAVAIAAIIATILTPKALHAVATAVNVVNQQANPVLSRNVDNPDAYPFEFSFCFVNNAFTTCTGVSPSIPTTTSDGRLVKLAVIDRVYFLTGQPANQVVDLFEIFQGNPFSESFNVSQSSNSSGGILNTGTRIYVDPGTQIGAHVEILIPGASGVTINMSGHLVAQ